MKQVNSFRYWLAFVFLLCMGMTAQAQSLLTVGTNDHGTVTFEVDGAAATTANEGKTVIVNITPKTLGWQVDKVTATAYTSWGTAGARGEMPTEIPAVKVIEVSGKWQFTMPAYNVQVNVTYKTTSMDKVTIAAVPDQTYTGFEIKPDLTVTYDGKPLAKGIDNDYIIKEWKNNINVGTATVIIEGVAANGFEGTKEATFKIVPKSINADKITVDAIPAQNYTGSQIKPTVTVKDGDRIVTLVLDKDYTVSYGENINAGTDAGSVKITGKGNYKDERVVKFTINKTAPTVTKAPTAKTGLVYNEKAQELVDGGTATGGKIQYSTDGGQTWKDELPTGTNAGDYPIKWKVKGDDNHNDTTPQDLTGKIAKAPIDGLTLTPSTFTYDGTQKQPTEKVTSGTMNVPSSGYTITGNKAIDGGSYTATVTATANGNFTGSKSATWTIGKADISDANRFTASLNPNTYVYDGTAKTPTVTVKDKTTGKNLTLTTDYTVAYSDNTNVGTGKVKVTGAGKNYSGTIDLTFTITKRAITSVTVKSNSLVFNGKEQTVQIDKVMAGNIQLNAADYEIVSGQKGTHVAEYTLKVKAKASSNFSGEATTKWNITPLSIADATVSLNPTSYTYDGTEKKPTATVKKGDLTLVAGTDFDVTYQNNINAGTATAKITGKGDYKDITSKDFTINPAKLTELTLSPDEYTYDGSEKSPAPTVKAGSLTVPAAGYTIKSGNKGTNAGNYTFKVEGKGNYTGTIEKGWKIKKANFSDTNRFTASLNPTTFRYDGTPKTPTVTVKDKTTGKNLTLNTDYTVAYSDNTNVGTGKVKVTGAGANYEGTINLTFTITNLAITSVTVKNNSLVFNGKEQTVQIDKVMAGDIQLNAADYEIVSGQKGTHVAEYTLKVQAKAGSNYAGDATTKWNITPLSIADATVTLNPTSYTYDGTEKKPTATVKKGDLTLVAGTDFDVTYQNNINAGTATAKITGKGDYKDITTKDFTINPAKLTSVTLKKSELTYIYNTNQTVQIDVVKAGDLTVTSDNYTVSGNTGKVAKGYTLTVTAKPNTNYTGSVTANWKIVPKSAKDFTVELDQREFTYDGTAKTPNVTVKDGSNVLEENTDYTLEFRDNVKAGINTAKVIVTGINNYTDKKEDVTFSILRAGGEIKAYPEQNTITLGETPDGYQITLVDPTPADLEEYYFVSGDENIATVDPETGYVTVHNAGVATIYIVVMGDRNYEGMTAISQVIVKPMEIVDADVTVGDADATGIPSFTVVKNGKTLVKGTDYEIEFYDKDEVKKSYDFLLKNAGDYMAVLTFSGNYYGVVEKKFKAAGVAVTTEKLVDDLVNANIPTNPDEAKKYDFNGDGEVNIADVQAALNLEMGLAIDGTPINGARAAVMTNEAPALLNVSSSDMGGGVTRYALSLEGNREFTAFQVDAVTTGSMQVIGGQSAGDMTLRTGTLQNGTRRILGFGAEQSGTVVYIDVMGEGSLSFDNICFSTQSANAFYARLAGNATGIDQLNAATADGEYFGIGGQRQNELKKGVNIVRQNGKSVKVLKK